MKMMSITTNDGLDYQTDGGWGKAKLATPEGNKQGERAIP